MGNINNKSNLEGSECNIKNLIVLPIELGSCLIQFTGRTVLKIIENYIEAMKICLRKSQI